ncbi:MAG: tetratricopeptide repeat protein [Pseudomonadales bacterium]
METYRTEEEQLAALKRWWKKNGTSILVGIALAVAAVFGWQSWQENQRLAGEEASELYFTLLEAVTLNDSAQTSTVMHLVEQLQNDHDSRTYAQYAALLAAKQALLSSDLELAEEQLNWAVDKAEQGGSLHNVATLRLARVIAAKGGDDNLVSALALIEDVDSGSYTASFEEVKGDLYLRLGRENEARNAYQAAADVLKTSNGDTLLIDMKLNDLAVAGEF